MTAASVAALTIYDMVKGVERGVEIRGVRLVSKTGGKSGTWIRQAPPRTRRPSQAAPRARESPAGRVEAQGQRVSPSVSEPPRRSALVITVSDGVAAGVREDGSGDASRGAPDEPWASPSSGSWSPTSSGRSRPPSSRAPRPRARRHDRRHRAHAARRDAAGDRGRHRLRGPRARRGDARRRPREHAARRPVARGRRRPRPEPHRQRARQPEGRGRVVRRHRAACWTTPSRPSPDRTITRSRPARRPAAGRPATDVRHRSRTSPATRSSSRSSGARPRSSSWRWPATCGSSRSPGRSRPVRERARSHGSPAWSLRLRPDRRCSRTRGPALMHAGIFWGFVLLTIGTANIVTGGLIQAVLSIPFDGLLWAADQRDAERRRRHRPRLDRLGVLPPPRHQARGG